MPALHLSRGTAEGDISGSWGDAGIDRGDSGYGGAEILYRDRRVALEPIADLRWGDDELLQAFVEKRTSLSHLQPALPIVGI